MRRPGALPSLAALTTTAALLAGCTDPPVEDEMTPAPVTKAEVLATAGGIMERILEDVVPAEHAHADIVPDQEGCRAGLPLDEGPPWRYRFKRYFQFDPTWEAGMQARLEELADEGWEVRRRADLSVPHPKWILVRDGYVINLQVPSTRNRENPTSARGPQPLSLSVSGPCVDE